MIILLVKCEWFGFCRDNSLEVQADVESKQEKVRHSSASSSLDGASCSSSTAGLKGAGPCSCPSTCCCAQQDTHCCPSPPWTKEPSMSGGKKSKGKLWKRASGSKGDRRMNETQGDMDAQLLEQRSTNSSEFDSPSLSGSLPSVADSHCSHFSSELSCSDLETSRPAHPLCSAPMDAHAHHAAAAFMDAALTPMPEVENDRLEHCPSQSSHVAFTHRLLSASPPASPKEGSGGTFLYISEESVGATAEPEVEESATEGNTAAEPESPTRIHCIQTEIWSVVLAQLSALSPSFTLKPKQPILLRKPVVGFNIIYDICICCEEGILRECETVQLQRG